MPEQFTGLVEIQTVAGETTITLNGNRATILAGDGDRAGVVSVRTGGGEERVRLDSDGVVVRDESGQEVIQLTGSDREILIRNASGQVVLRLEGDSSTLHIGDEETAGTLLVFGEEDPTVRIEGALGAGEFVSPQTTVLIDGAHGFIRLGSATEEGELLVRNAHGEHRIRLRGGAGDPQVGELFNPDTTVYIDGEHGFIRLGSPTEEGDLVLTNGEGQETIRILGGQGDIQLLNADCAEEFEMAEETAIPAGTVVVLDEEGKIRPSNSAYDKRVAGVVSGAGDFRPGIVLDKRESPGNREAIALMGKVFCQVTAEKEPIAVGDLLTTADISGCAMKAADPARAFGAVIGKALKPLGGGRGLIPILIALQ
jgi:hypothetical protein